MKLNAGCVHLWLKNQIPNLSLIDEAGGSLGTEPLAELRTRTQEKIRVLDSVTEKLEQIKHIGANLTLNSGKLNVEKNIHNVTPPKGSENRKRRRV